MSLDAVKSSNGKVKCINCESLCMSWLKIRCHRMAVAAQLYKWVEYPLLSLFTDNLKCTVHWYAYSLVKLLAIFSVLWRGLYFGRNLLPLQYSLLLLSSFSRSVVSNPLATPWTGALQASLFSWVCLNLSFSLPRLVPRILRQITVSASILLQQSDLHSEDLGCNPGANQWCDFR